MGGKKPFVVACIPAYNEERTIAKVVLQTMKYVDKVIVCDDGSSDLTGEIAERLGAEVIRHKTNLGKGAALRSLFETGRKMNPDVSVTMDADDQHNPEEIPKLVKPILEGKADVVIGCRFSFDNSIPAIRRWGNRVLSFLTNVSIRSKVKDTQSGFRAYSRKAIRVINVIEDGMAVDSQIFVEAKEKGLMVVEVPVSTRYPKDVKTSKKNPLQHGAEVILSILELVGERRPLLMLGIPGSALLGVGGASFVMILKIFNETREIAIGTAMLGIVSTLLGTLFLFGALILWILGKRLRRLENYISSQR